MTSSSVAADSSAPELPSFPMDRDTRCPLDPPPALRNLQRQGPISKVRMWDGREAWLITGYEYFRTLLADSRISSDGNHPKFPYRAEADRVRKSDGQNIVTMDDPEHARQRRMVTAPFAIKKIEEMRPGVQKIVDGLIDGMLAGPKPVDLVEAFALPIPTLLICDMLGVPYSDHLFFENNTKLTMTYGIPAQQVLTAQREMTAYLEKMIEDKTINPGKDMLSLLAQRVKDGSLTQRDANQMAATLISGGHETSANMIALGTYTLLQHPDQLALLKESDDPKVVAFAVEEILRFVSVSHLGRMRLALADIEIGGHTIREGDAVILTVETANRDPEAFPEPDKFDITRDARHHVAFAYGVHQCLGQPLARMELQVVYRTLFERIPDLTLAVDASELQFKYSGFVFGLHKLPVTW